jgi:tRNA A-37 threonylcarbamoyl transferase component Bud32
LPVFSSSNSIPEEEECANVVRTIATEDTKALLDPDVSEVVIPKSFTLRNNTSSLTQLTHAANFDGKSEPPMGRMDVLPAALHTSRSTPGLFQPLTQKLPSSLLYNHTVIHRPKLNSRPTVLSTSFAQQPTDTPDTQQLPDKTMSDSSSLRSQPSIFLLSSNLSSNPLSILSTAPTSLTSSATPHSAETTNKAQLGFRHVSTGGSPLYEPITEKMNSQWLVFPRQDSPRLTPPSVVTVESAASAKIFFESHFDVLLSTKPSPRSMRQRDLERKLFAMALPNDKRQEHKQKLRVAESNHLRQTRVLKSKTLTRQRTKGVHISNYDIVRVLGKGSFGVVRLVREKSDVIGSTDHSGSTGSDTLSYMDGTSDADAPELILPKQKQVYAMKVIRKSDMLRNSQEGHLRAERDFLVASENSRWVVPLIASFQDSHNLYLVMEYMVGGDFLGLLLREDILDENIAKWYLAEMILCIEEAHKMNWIHRDVKPDNFLITASGHLKISDFGLAFDGHWSHNQTYYTDHRYSLLRDLDLHVNGDTLDCEEERQRQDVRRTFDLINGKTTSRHRFENKQDEANGPILDWLNQSQRRQFAKSVVGTSQYMAPEVIRGENYDGRCDWWSIGIILYEVTRMPPLVMRRR